MIKNKKIIAIIAVIVCLSSVSAFRIGHLTSHGQNNGNIPMIFGYGNAIVLSGSMSPEINVDDMIIIRFQNEYQINDIITFWDQENIVTHRIVGRTADGFVTKGDNNNTEDLLEIKQENIKGRVVAVVPKMGMIFRFIKSPLGIMTVLCTLILIVFFPKLISKLKSYI